MASTITAAFSQQWREEMQVLFHQQGSKLRDATTVITGVVGATYNFPRIGSIVANTKTRNADLTGIDPTIDNVPVTLADAYATIYLDKLDELKSNADYKTAFQGRVVQAINDKLDDTISAAIELAANTTTTQTGGLTFAKILEGLTALNKVDVPPADRYLLVGAQQITDALNIVQLTNSQYMTIGAIQQAGFGSAMGFNWVMTNRLTLVAGAPNSRHCYALSKAAVGTVMGEDLVSSVDFIPQKDSTQFMSKISVGSVILDNTGIVRIKCDE
ncbi:MAG: phage capsid protein [Burkholderiales bacterium]